MKVGIMQPYFLPYIGYWQLMNAVDVYVIYDDVNFIKGGWVNRNRILYDNKPRYINIPMMGASSFKHINQIKVNDDEKLIDANLRIIEIAYNNAPYYNEVQPLIEQIYRCGKKNIAEFIEESFHIMDEYLGITTKLIRSSSLEKDCSLKGQDKVLAICELLGATEYYNAIGGQKLYSFAEFQERGIELKFLETGDIRYEQFGNAFEPALSIIDVMMFNSKTQVREFLNVYSLIGKEQYE